MLKLLLMKPNMFKRFQILLADWQETYIRYICKKHNYSFSELIRFFLSLGFLNNIPLLSPRYKPGISKKRLSDMIKKVSKLASIETERHKFISMLHFEARKAVEHRLREVKKQKEKHKY